METIAAFLLPPLLLVVYLGVFSLGAVPGVLFIPWMIHYFRQVPAWWACLLCVLSSPIIVLLVLLSMDLARHSSGFTPLFPWFCALELLWILLALWWACFWVYGLNRSGPIHTMRNVGRPGKLSAGAESRQGERQGDTGLFWLDLHWRFEFIRMAQAVRRSEAGRPRICARVYTLRYRIKGQVRRRHQQLSIRLLSTRQRLNINSRTVLKYPYYRGFTSQGRVRKFCWRA